MEEPASGCPPAAAPSIRSGILAGLFGTLLAVALLKFGNPVILGHHLAPPQNGWELVFSAWPIEWALPPLVILSLVAVMSSRPEIRDRLRAVPKPLWILPLAWYGWQWVAALDTIDTNLTRVTLAQFTGVVLCYYVGLGCLGKGRSVWPFWWALVGGFAFVLWSALDQRFGGLEATRRMLYEGGGMEQYPPEFLRRIATGRVFGTLFYPNALAGAILLLAPPLWGFLRRRLAGAPNVWRGTALGLFAYLCLASLYWSGSKAGWLIAAGLAGLAVWSRPLSPKLRWGALTLVLVVAIGVFSIRFGDYIRRGAASASARLDYWSAAWATAIQNPLTGTGPGTFQIPYGQLKRPESEMARLAHNDYLQQASDTGFPGGILYFAFAAGFPGMLYRKSWREHDLFLPTLGLVGWAIHGFVEFGLFIPGLAWPAYAILGLTLGQRFIRSTTPGSQTIDSTS